MSNCPVELAPTISVKGAEDLEDFELIRRTQVGDTEAFGALVVKYRARLFTVIWCMVGNENDAWDLAQEGFVKAWRSIHRFEGRSSYVAVPNHFALGNRLLRRQGRRSEVELDDRLPSYLPAPRLTMIVTKFENRSTWRWRKFLQSIEWSLCSGR